MSAIRECLDGFLGVWSRSGDAPMTDQARTVGAYVLRWAAANCTYDMRHEEVRHGGRERAIPVLDLEALADELEDK
jgi:hypothetical protein